jgi:tetratricopeptide (TPR) repeat protein
MRKGMDNRVRSAFCIVLAGYFAVVGYRTSDASEDPAAEAGALLAAGRTSEAASAARACPEARCKLVLSRALFGLGKLQEAADALAPALPDLGPLRPHAEALVGEALLLAKKPRDAVAALRLAAAAEGPAGLRASALLADALLAAGDLAEARKQADRAVALADSPPTSARGSHGTRRWRWRARRGRIRSSCARRRKRSAASGLHTPSTRPQRMRAGWSATWGSRCPSRRGAS